MACNPKQYVIKKGCGYWNEQTYDWSGKGCATRYTQEEHDRMQLWPEESWEVVDSE